MALVRVARGVLSATIVVAIVFELQHSVDTAFQAVNFFSFFTILSNVGAAALLAFETFRPPSEHGPAASAFRGAITLYMTITFVVYSVLLGPSDIGGPQPWVNFVVHFLAPIALLVDWLLVSAVRLPSRTVVLAWLGWPLVWVVYTLVRGAAEGWYPYPFLDPDESGGYAGILGYCAAILAVFLATGLALHWWATRTRQRLVSAPA